MIVKICGTDKHMVGYRKQKTLTLDKSNESNNLNSFYARLDCYNISKQNDDLRGQLTNDEEPKKFKEQKVTKIFSQLKPNKACGPDFL